MKIVFLAPVQEGGKVPSEYKDILNEAKQLGHDLIDGFTKKEKDSLQSYYKHVLSLIKTADAVVVEGTTLTVETSRFISAALQFRLPVLLLYKKNNPEAQIFETSRLLSLKKYNANLPQLLERFFKQIHKQRLLYRFNIMLSREMDSYVMDKSRKQKVSKADYIRDLILRDMENKS